MPAPVRIAKGAAALVMLAALTVTAPAAPGAPTQAAVSAADKILGDIGVKESIAAVVPGMMRELEANVTRTRPEIKDSLRATLRAIQPEFDQSAREAYDEAATLLASQMSEKEITDVAAFFESPSGKKYVAVTPVFVQKLTDVTAPWRDKLSTDIVTRARQEMKKKGVDF
jgi:hypothetical protein